MRHLPAAVRCLAVATLLGAFAVVAPGLPAAADLAPATTVAALKPVVAPPLPCNGPLACADDSAMRTLERRIQDNIRYGQALEIDYRTPERVLGDVASGGAWGDSALWTGTFLASEALRTLLTEGEHATGA